MRWELLIGGLGVLVVAVGHYMGLFWTPPEAMMGDTGRILYVHVSTAWMSMLAYLAAFIFASGSLWSERRAWDAGVEASVEVGVVLNALLLFQGAVWAKPTWGVYWTWDPRLTTTAIMAVSFVGVLVMRSLIHAPERRRVATAVATIIAAVNVPIVYYSVEWWNTQHQGLSSTKTVDSPMLSALLVACVGTALLAVGLVGARWRLAMRDLSNEEAAPDLPDQPAPLDLEKA